MTNNEEKIRILNMVQEGKITALEASQLLEALDVKPEEETRSVENRANTITKFNGKVHWVRIQVTNLVTGKTEANVKLPLGIVKVGMNATMKMNFKGEKNILNEIDLDELLKDALERDNPSGVLVDVEDPDGGEHVVISLE